MTLPVTSLPTASGNLASGSVSASASPFYTDTDAGRAAQPVSAGVDLHTPKTSAHLTRGLALLFAALLALGLGHTATKAIEKAAYSQHMQSKGW